MIYYATKQASSSTGYLNIVADKSYLRVIVSLLDLRLGKVYKTDDGIVNLQILIKLL